MLARIIADSPPKSNNARKINVSETEMRALARGMGILNRGQIKTVASVSKRNRTSSWGSVRRKHEKNTVTRAAAIINQMYMRCSCLRVIVVLWWDGLSGSAPQRLFRMEPALLLRK